MYRRDCYVCRISINELKMSLRHELTSTSKLFASQHVEKIKGYNIFSSSDILLFFSFQFSILIKFQYISVILFDRFLRRRR